MLTPSQEKAVQAFEEFLQDPDQKRIVITGAAGTGKTYLINAFIKLIRNIDSLNTILTSSNDPTPIALTALTHKACQVLNNSLNKENSHSYVITLHKFLGLVVKEEKGKVFYSHKTFSFARPDTVLFIDEASMLDKELLGILDKKYPDLKVVFFGDIYQIPPVGEKESPIFKLKNIHYLTEVVRQSQDNSILELAYKFKSYIDNEIPDVWPEIESDGKNIVRIPKNEKEQYLYNLAYLTYDKYIAYTNKKVRETNLHIRDIYGLPKHPSLGDILYLYSNKKINTHVEFSVKYLEPSTVNIKVIDTIKTIPVYKTRSYGIPLNLVVNEEEYFEIEQTFRMNKDWHSYYKAKELFNRWEFTYAITAHKSQGSTYDNVYLDLDDIGKNKDKLELAKLMYTAITRARDTVYVLGSLNGGRNA